MKIRLFLLLFLIFPIANAKVGVFYFYESKGNNDYIHAMEENFSFVNVMEYNVSQNRDLYISLLEIYNASYCLPIAFVGNEWYCLGNMSERSRFENDLKYFEGKNIPFPCENGTYNFPKAVFIAEFYNFSSEKEREMASLLNEMLKGIKFLNIMRFNTFYKENISLFENFFPSSNLPSVVVGNRSFSMKESREIYDYAKSYEKIGIECMDFLNVERNICLVFFYNPVCHSCREAKEKLEWLKAKYPISIKEYNLLTETGNKLLFRYYKVFNVSTRGSFAIFIGDKYFYKLSQFSLLEKEIKKYVGTGIECPHVGNAGSETGFFNTITLFTVISGGLLDGINPCAFATLVFFIAYLERTKKKRSHLLAIGISFSTAVFIGYFLIGIGILEFFYRVEDIGLISKYVYLFAGFFSIFIAALNFRDFLMMDEKKPILQLPNFMKRRRGRIIRIITAERNIIFLSILAFIVGIAISTLEFVCTGEILFPVMAVIKSASPERIMAIIYLLVYNFMFIVPLLLILALFYYGYSSQEIGSIQKKRHKYVKLFTAILMGFIGFYMLSTMF